METREIYELARKSYPNFMIAVETEEGFVFYNDEKDAWRIKYCHAESRGEKEPEDSGDTYTISYNELRELMPYFNQAEGLRVLMCNKGEEGEIVVRELVVDHSVREVEMGRIKKEKRLVMKPHYADGVGKKEWCELLKIDLPHDLCGEKEEIARTIERYLREERNISLENKDKKGMEFVVYDRIASSDRRSCREYGTLNGKPTEFCFGVREENGALAFCVYIRNVTYTIGEEEMITEQTKED